MRRSSRLRSLILWTALLAIVPSAAWADGAIEGTVTFWGDPGGGTQIEVAAHSDPYGPPDETVYIPISGGAYSIPIADGTYYVSTLMPRDGVFGEPRLEDVLVWYDADADGHRDAVTVSGGTVSGVDIDLGFIYVDIDATGANAGTSWTDAFTSYHSAVSLAVSGVEIWVAEGTYVPGGMPTSTFGVKSGVRVFGGFAGGETTRQERDWDANPTIFSCEIGSVAATDNCFHVVTATDANETAVLDGITITRGYADGGGTHDIGGGLNVFGGGMSLVNSTVIDNHAEHYGGGAHTRNISYLVAYNSTFADNHAEFSGGGFYMHAEADHPSMAVNCVFTGNSAYAGAGLMVYGAVSGTPEEQPQIVNITANGNTATEGGAIYANTSGNPVTISNAVLWGNTASTGPELWYETFYSLQPVVNYSIVQGGWALGTQILTADPSFVPGSLRPSHSSPAIDSGDNTAVPQDIFVNGEYHWQENPRFKDLDHMWRYSDIPTVPDTGVSSPGDHNIDMGAYEAYIPTEIFEDGFESGDFSAWTSATP